MGGTHPSEQEVRNAVNHLLEAHQAGLPPNRRSAAAVGSGSWVKAAKTRAGESFSRGGEESSSTAMALCSTNGERRFEREGTYHNTQINAILLSAIHLPLILADITAVILRLKIRLKKEKPFET